MKLFAFVILAACAAPQYPHVQAPSTDDTAPASSSSDPVPGYDWQEAARRRDQDDDDRRRADDAQQLQQQQQQQNDAILQQQQQIYDQAQQQLTDYNNQILSQPWPSP